MKKRLTIKKIVLATVITSMLCTQIILPSTVSAAVLNYDHPNGSNPYKLKASDIVNPEVFMSVVGCTGIVNKTASAITGFLADYIKQKGEEVVKSKTIEAPRDLAINASIPESAITPGITDAVIETYPLKPTVKVEDDQAQRDTKMTNCLNGIAIQLARNQLTKMTRDTMNWVNTGFNGDPFFVGEINSFMDNLTNDLIIKENDLLLSDPNSYPYGRNYATLTSMMQRAVHSGNLYAQDLTDKFILGTPGESTDDAIQRFANDFSVGGWNGWLALTQHPKDNPIGFQIAEDQRVYEGQENTIENTKAEIIDGFLPQKKCTDYEINSFTHKSECVSYETVTPGSTIRDKVAKYINTPETQLELVDTMNGALNSLFSALIYRLFDQGLTGLGDNQTNNLTLSNLPNTDNSSFASTGFSGSFDLTRDLPGIIQIQKDYIPAARKSLTDVLPLVLPAVGKLDYCIPGPNPDWQNNSRDTMSNLDEYLGNIRTQVIKIPDECNFAQDWYSLGACELLPDTKDSTILNLPDPSTYKSAFPAATNLWGKVKDIFMTSIPDFKTINPGKLFRDNDSSLGPFKSYGAISNRKEIFDWYSTSQHQVDSKVKGWTDYIKNFKDEYITKINSLYGPKSPMQSGLDANGNQSTKYLQMASAGLSVTKNLKTYDDEITTEISDYNDSITEATANIFKLQKIKDQVDVIVAAARKRRANYNATHGIPVIPTDCLDGKNAEVINITGNDCLDNSGKIEKITDASGKTKTVTIECIPTAKIKKP